MKFLYKIIQISVFLTVVYFMTPVSNISINSIENTTMNKTVNLSTMAMTIIDNEYDKLYTSLEIVSGELTSYVYNCDACTGRLACMSSLDLSNGTTTYNDEDYGEVYIVASSSNLPCGSIVSFDSKLSEDTMYAIVLDRGVIGDDLDLLVWDLEYAYVVGRSEITYNILRIGW